MSIPSPYTLPMLEQARAAYHRLMTGTAAVEIHDQNGDKVVFQRANSQDLYLYIQRIEAALYPDCSSAAVKGPLGAFF